MASHYTYFIQVCALFGFGCNALDMIKFNLDWTSVHSLANGDKLLQLWANVCVGACVCGCILGCV